MFGTTRTLSIQTIHMWVREFDEGQSESYNNLHLAIATVPSWNSMMNVLMSVFASSLGDEIFTVLPELPTQQFSSLTFFLRCSVDEKTNRERYLLNAPHTCWRKILKKLEKIMILKKISEGVRKFVGKYTLNLGKVCGKSVYFKN